MELVQRFLEVRSTDAETFAENREQTAIAREEHLVSLVGREQKLWAKVDVLITTTQPTS